MKNRIINITKKEAELIKADAVRNKEIYFAEIDGRKIQTEEDYVRAAVTAFEFPHGLPAMKIGWYNDYIMDLMWIEPEGVVLIIHNYDLMLVDHFKLKSDIISDFKEIILPWWEGEVVGHMVGGKPRKFTVYLESMQTNVLR